MRLTAQNKADIKKYLLNAINSTNDEYDETYTEKKTVEYCYNRFIKEYDYDIKQSGFFIALQNWLSGLAINIDYMNYDILAKAEEWGQLMYREKDREKIIEQWFKFIAMQLIKMFRTHKLNCY